MTDGRPSGVEILDRQSVYRGFFGLSILQLRHALYRGGWSEPVRRELFHRGTCVGVLPFDRVRREVLLIEQFRIGALDHRARPWLTEIVAGAVEPGETPEDVARREGWEEAGVRFQCLHRLGEFFTSPGGSSERVTLFVGEVDGPLQAGEYGRLEEQEDIRAQVVPLDEALDWLAAGDIDSLMPALTLMWLKDQILSGKFG